MGSLPCEANDGGGDSKGLANSPPRDSGHYGVVLDWDDYIVTRHDPTTPTPSSRSVVGVWTWSEGPQEDLQGPKGVAAGDYGRNDMISEVQTCQRQFICTCCSSLLMFMIKIKMEQKKI